MRTSAKAVAVIALAGFASGALAPRLPAQTAPAPRPMPRSSQGGPEQLRALIDAAAGFEVSEVDEERNEAQAMLLSPTELDDLMAPIALYPDPLLAQILVASAHPIDVVQAERLLEDSGEITNEELSVLIAEQDWDPSVMVLLQGFPEVIRMMAEDLDWTKDVGDAMLFQDREVLESIQRRRREAYDAGNLISNEAQQVEPREDQIAIEPTIPGQVHVPYYDQEQVYSTRRAPPPQAAGSQNPIANPIVAGAIAFGSALLISQLFGGDGEEDEDDWNDYWSRKRSIDWDDRDVYARPQDAYRWRSERDQYWRWYNGRWHRGAEQDPKRERARRDAVRWLEQDNEVREERLKELRSREIAARNDARRLEEREREARERAKRKEERRREALRSEEREQRRIDQQRADARKSEERKAREQKAERQEAQERKAHDQRRKENAKKAKVERRQKQRTAEKENAGNARKEDQGQSRQRENASKQKAQKKQNAAKEGASGKEKSRDRTAKTAKKDKKAAGKNNDRAGRPDRSEGKRKGDGKKKECKSNDKKCR